jgi:two-component system nitrate/nitrite response regulator NarL
MLFIRAFHTTPTGVRGTTVVASLAILHKRPESLPGIQKEKLMTPPTPPDPISVLMIDRDKLVREGIRTLMLATARLKLVADTDSVAESLALASHEQPDVILLALDLGNETGLDLLPGLLSASAKSRVVVLTQAKDPEQDHKAMLMGAMGVVQKGLGSEILFKAIEKIHAGEIWFDRSTMGSVLRDIQRIGMEKKLDPVAARIGSLTRREHEVIGLISEGLKNREIGERLFISETTVRHHLTSVFEKLEVTNRLELIIFAFSRGLASLPDNGQSTSSRYYPARKPIELAPTM